MDLKAFAKFIMMIGICILAFGVFRYVTNQPVEFNYRAEPRAIGNLFERAISSFFSFVNNLIISTAVEVSNINRETERESAKKIMTTGAIILFFGVVLSGISYISSGTDSKLKEKKTTADNTGSFLCPYCNLAIHKNAKFCPYCGKSLDPAFSSTKERIKLPICLRCRATVSPKAKFCKVCGFKLEDV